jgi:hypothetical protein
MDALPVESSGFASALTEAAHCGKGFEVNFNLSRPSSWALKRNMRRREFITLLCGALPLAAGAQQNHRDM